MDEAQEDRRRVRGNRTLPFVGIPSFLRTPICTDLDTLDADIAVMGVPTDEGSPFLPGSRFAPRSMREHSMRFGANGYYDPETKKMFLEHELTNGRIADVGDATVLPTNAADTFHNITALTLKGAGPRGIAGGTGRRPRH